MTPPPRRARVRRLARAAALLLPLWLAVALAAPAVAETPEGWPDGPPISGLHTGLLLAGIPALVIIVVGVLVVLPTLRQKSYTPGMAWRNENTWFGGPEHGLDDVARDEPAALEAGADASAESDPTHRGGASARW